MHRKERQIYEKANGAPCLQDRSRGKEILGDALEQIKIAANKRDVPYQSLIKMWLAEKVG